jgi:LPXTG-motif cell wall-anchored protein
MRSNLHRRATRWALAGSLAASGLVLAAAVGSPATASVGGSAQAQAARVTVGDISINAATNSPLFDDLVAQLNGDALVVGASVATDAATTPPEPFGQDHKEVVGLDVPDGNQIVTLRTLNADTSRLTDSAHSEYWQSMQDGLEALSNLGVATAQLGTIPILAAEEISSRADVTANDVAPDVVDPPTATASVATLSIGGTPFDVVPNVPVNAVINLTDAQLDELVNGIADLPLDQLNVLSSFGSITVTAGSVTSVGVDTASAVGLQAAATLDLHVSLGFVPAALRSQALGWRSAPPVLPVLELNASGTLFEMVLAESEVSRPQGDPTTTTTTVSSTVAPTTTAPVVTTVPPLPQTGSTSTPLAAWAMIVTAGGATISLLARRRGRYGMNH